MKKLLMITAALLCMAGLFAEMTWADYEMLCAKAGKEASYEEYVELMNVPATEYGDDESEALTLLGKND